jgi:hypothetical protein
MPERLEPKNDGQPRIEVITSHGTHHRFTPKVLDVMLERGHVMQFKRKSGWVTVGIDPIRIKRSDKDCCTHYGWDRRTPQ